jgi:hypothetical protein
MFTRECPFSCKDNEPWTPDDDFGELFIRVSGNGSCVISGPEGQVDALRKQVIEILSEGQEEKIPESVTKVEIKE